MPPTDDELLASNPDAAMLIAAGVPREEVLKNLRMTAETSGPLKGVIMRADRSRFASSVLPLGAFHISAVAALGMPLADGALGLLLLLLLLVVHRMLWVRLVPPMVLATEPPPLLGAPTSLSTAVFLAAASLAASALSPSGSIIGGSMSAVLAACAVTAAVVASAQPTDQAATTSAPSPLPPLVPALPSWLVRGAGALIVTLVALVSSFGYHGVMRASCPAAAATSPCAAAASHTPLVAAWATLVGLVVALEHSLERADGPQPPPSRSERSDRADLWLLTMYQPGPAVLPSRSDAWPLIAQQLWLRLRPLLAVALSGAAARASQLALGATLAAWLAPSAVDSLGALALALSGGCTPCAAPAAEELSMGDAPGSEAAASAASATGLGLWFSMLLRSWAFVASCRLGFSAVHVAYTQPLDFRRASASRLGDEKVLMAAMAKEAPPLTQHLAYLDAVTLARHEPARRQALFLFNGGAAWHGFLLLLLGPIDVMATNLKARKERAVPFDKARAPNGTSIHTSIHTSMHTSAVPERLGAPASKCSPRRPPCPLLPQAAVPKGSLPLALRRLTARLTAMSAAMHEQAARSSIFGSTQLVVWAAEAVSCLLAAALIEDQAGVVHKKGSLSTALTSLTRCLQALEAYTAGGGTPLGAARTRQPAAQQAIALRVSERSGPAQDRAQNDAHRAEAVKGAISRALFLLMQTYGYHAIAIEATHLPEEQRMRLQAFLREAGMLIINHHP